MWLTGVHLLPARLTLACGHRRISGRRGNTSVSAGCKNRVKPKSGIAICVFDFLNLPVTGYKLFAVLFVSQTQRWQHLHYRFYSNKRRGAYKILHAPNTASVWGRLLFESWTRQRVVVTKILLFWLVRGCGAYSSKYDVRILCDETTRANERRLSCMLLFLFIK